MEVGLLAVVAFAAQGTVEKEGVAAVPDLVVDAAGFEADLGQEEALLGILPGAGILEAVLGSGSPVGWLSVGWKRDQLQVQRVNCSSAVLVVVAVGTPADTAGSVPEGGPGEGAAGDDAEAGTGREGAAAADEAEVGRAWRQDSRQRRG